MGYGLVFNPPHQEAHSYEYSVAPAVYAQIDFGRLFLEWAALAALTGMVWMIVVKPARTHDDKANQSPQSTGKPEK